VAPGRRPDNAPVEGPGEALDGNILQTRLDPAPGRYCATGGPRRL